MPELPEVESLRRDLVPHLTGRTITGAELRLPKLMAKWGGLGPEALIQRRIEGIGRRAKILWFDLSDDLVMLAHLKLSGQLALRSAEGATLAAGGHPVPTYDAPLPHKSTHLILDLDDGSRLYFTDIRQFGRIAVLPREEAEAKVASMRHGPEPLGEAFDLAEFRRRLARRPKPPIKTLLLDQGFVAGLGNIYANEALGEARLAPTRHAGSLSDDESARLYGAIRAVLARALDEGIAEIRHSRAASQRDFPRFHGREAAPCYDCGTPIARLKLNGRSCYYCPTCQT